MALTPPHNDQMTAEDVDFFYSEMIIHPVLFTHPRPQKIVLIGNEASLLREAVKHSALTQIVCLGSLAQTKPIADQRIQYYDAEPLVWLANEAEKNWDIIIQTQLFSDQFSQQDYQHYYQALQSDGILIQPCPFSFIQPKRLKLKPIFHSIQQAGFSDWQTLNFPQLSQSSWCTAIMATKGCLLHRIREKDIFNRSFTTHYYNFDTHKAALAIPEFVHHELKVQSEKI